MALLKQNELIETELKTLQAAAVHPNVVDFYGYMKTSMRQDKYRTVTRFKVSEFAECVLKQMACNGEFNRRGKV